MYFYIWYAGLSAIRPAMNAAIPLGYAAFPVYVKKPSCCNVRIGNDSAPCDLCKQTKLSQPRQKAVGRRQQKELWGKWYDFYKKNIPLCLSNFCVMPTAL